MRVTDENRVTSVLDIILIIIQRSHKVLFYEHPVHYDMRAIGR